MANKRAFAGQIAAARHGQILEDFSKSRRLPSGKSGGPGEADLIKGPVRGVKAGVEGR
jgi:hypothetical protein